MVLLSMETSLMMKLSDTQLVLLSTASQRADHNFHPLPASHPNADTRVTRAIAALMKAGFAEGRDGHESLRGRDAL